MKKKSRNKHNSFVLSRRIKINGKNKTEATEMLWKYFFKPAAKGISNLNSNDIHLLEAYFCMDERYIFFAKALRACEIPCETLSPGGVIIPGMPPLKLKEKQKILITVDKKLPDATRISLLNEKKGDKVYLLRRHHLKFLLAQDVVKPFGAEWKRFLRSQLILKQQDSISEKKK